MRVKREFYGWHDPIKGYLVSRLPPDAPVRPEQAYETANEVMEMIERRRARIYWWPPLAEGAL